MEILDLHGLVGLEFLAGDGDFLVVAGVSGEQWLAVVIEV